MPLRAKLENLDKIGVMQRKKEKKPIEERAKWFLVDLIRGSLITTQHNWFDYSMFRPCSVSVDKVREVWQEKPDWAIRKQEVIKYWQDRKAIVVKKTGNRHGFKRVKVSLHQNLIEKIIDAGHDALRGIAESNEKVNHELLRQLLNGLTL